MLQVETLRAAVANQLIGNRIIVLERATSTNDVVWQFAKGSAEGLVVFAEQQTAGRGQHGNRWESAARKGLYFSILLRPEIAPNEALRVTSWAAETIANVLRHNYSLDAEVKPPNDVYVAEKKLAGILLEMRAVPSTHVGILGIGINVNQTQEDFPMELRERAASIRMLTSHEVDRDQLAVALLRELNRTYAP